MMRGFSLVMTIAGCLTVSPFALGQASPTTAPATAAAEDAEAAYTRRITQRSARLVEALRLNDPAKAEAVQRILIDQYRAMQAIHTDRDARLNALATADAAPADQIDAEARTAMAEQRRAFDAALGQHLSADEVERVKDLLTVDMVPLSFKTLQAKYPALTPAQKARLMAYLLDARDLALDAGSVEEKLDAFRANKFRMDRYLTHQGYDVKRINAEWDAKTKAATQKAE